MGLSTGAVRNSHPQPRARRRAAYPGAYTELGGSTLRILRTRIEPAPTASGGAPGFYVDAQGSFALCADGGQLRILEMELDGAPFHGS
jgi:hypothetical protein